MKILKKTLACFFILSLMIDPRAAQAAILDMDYPSPTEAMDQIMADLGLDKTELEKNINETADVADRKNNPPTVTLSFVPESPAPGKEITAMAKPSYFTGDPERMYYTWYLKRDECEEAEEGDNDYVEECDLNRDNEVDIEDWKIEAMRLLAKGDWEPDYAAKSIIETDEDSDGNGYPDSYDRYYELVEEESGRDQDEDSYASVFGGEDQKGKPEHCYVKDIESGIDYEIHAGPSELGTGSASGYGTIGEDILPVDISEVDFLGSVGASIVGNVGEWEMEQFLQSVEIPNVQGSAINFEYGSPTGWPAVYDLFDHASTCDPNVSSCPEPDHAGDRCEDVCGSDSQCAWDFCGDGVAWIIYEVKEGDEYTGRWRGERMDWLRPGQTDKPEAWSTTIPETSQPVEGCKTYGFMLTALNNANSVQERTNIVSVTMPGEDCGPVCEHVFPKKYYVDGNNIRIFEDDDEDLLVGDPDNERFTVMEEKFWGTDPESKDTNNDGAPDEQALTGLGMMQFKWTYQEGDEVGVAVEGVSNNTDYQDSSLKTMWGVVNNDFEGDGFCQVNPSTMTVGTGSEAIERYITAGTDINDCLEENFTDPARGTIDKKIGVSLSYSPQYPINDTEGNNSDDLIVKADLTNIENKSYAKYEWTPYACLSDTDEQCTLLDRNMLDDYDSGLLKTSGLGLDTVKMNLQLPTNTLFLKFKLRVIETTEETSGKIGEGQIFIPLQHTSDDIIPHSIRAIEDLALPADVRLAFSGTRYDNLTEECPEKTCSAVKNEIIGMRFNGTVNNKTLSWSLDGKPLMSSPADPRNIYFPILKDSGSTYSVKLNIVDNSGTALGQEKIVLARDFKVEDPEVTLEPENCTLPEEGGSCSLVAIGDFYDPLDHNVVLSRDYSQELFRATQDSTITIAPAFNFDTGILFDSSSGLWKVRWFVDGSEVFPDNAPDPLIPTLTPDGGIPSLSLDLPIEKEPGEKYSVSFQALYTQPMLIKRALGNIWNVPDSSFYEKIVNDSLEIEVVADGSIQASSGTQKVLASLFAGMPEYLNFLLRIVLTLALIIFMANLSLVFFPKKN